jgi:hypothetical protein
LSPVNPLRSIATHTSTLTLGLYAFSPRSPISPNGARNQITKPNNQTK